MERDEARPETPPGGRPRDGAFAPTRLTSARPPVALWLAVSLIGLAVAVVKPWATEPAGGRPGGAVTTVGQALRSGPPPGATVRPDSAGPLVALFCLDPESWRIATIERWRDQTIRVWRAIEPVASATGPNDTRIPVFPIVSEGVTELGWCAPVAGPERPVGLATIEAWQRTPVGSVAIRTISTRPTGIGVSFGGLYAPPGDPDVEVWPDGGYVFRYHEPTGRERWFAVEVELRPSTGTVD
jgi:hypothetical protein